jgi:hypothetical protein
LELGQSPGFADREFFGFTYAIQADAKLIPSTGHNGCLSYPAQFILYRSLHKYVVGKARANETEVINRELHVVAA